MFLIGYMLMIMPMYQLEKITPKDYIRAFNFKGLGYLLIDFSAQHYFDRGFLWMYENDLLRSYIPRSIAAETMKIGRAIFSQEENFVRFEKGFREVIAESESYLKTSRQKTVVTINDVCDLKAIVQKLYYYFEKTEFFFTDGCFENTDALLEKNMLVLGDDLKMKSRPLLVELLTTCLYHYADLAAAQHGTNVEDVKFYSIKQLIRLLEQGTLAPDTIIRARQHSYLIYSENGRGYELDGIDKKLVLGRFAEPDYSNMTECGGTIANRGKVTARARVILPEYGKSYEDFVKSVHLMEMPQGTILVTETTSPEFVPLMKKAGGIIANQGGLNSHAAIMSRELGVPCLVATHHATDIIRDGDLIELDATNGKITVLKRAAKYTSHL